MTEQQIIQLVADAIESYNVKLSVYLASTFPEKFPSACTVDPTTFLADQSTDILNWYKQRQEQRALDIEIAKAIHYLKANGYEVIKHTTGV